jgi:hypothetical protein
MFCSQLIYPLRNAFILSRLSSSFIIGCDEANREISLGLVESAWTFAAPGALSSFMTPLMHFTPRQENPIRIG